MPTPHGTRGGMAFGAEELRVLRRALALALNPSPVSAEEVQDCLRLAESVDEAAREDARLRAFLLADLARYRAALPGTVTGYAALLTQALDTGYRPHRTTRRLRRLRGNPPPLPRALLPAPRCPGRARPFRGRAAVSAVVVPASRSASGRSRLRLTAPGGLAARDSHTRAAGEPARPPRPAVLPRGAGRARRQARPGAPPRRPAPGPPTRPHPPARSSRPAEAARPAREPAPAVGRRLALATLDMDYVSARCCPLMAVLFISSSSG
ncbi:hypothetical protein E4N62_17955 [Streptomyces sp. MNU76]|uniref:hypothetical protein n=1 Tax=Streptomyces sp. MNU76 TaxID=2560026 RepID=UPI001E32B188|nr:hypothetical protein [Streptomyces sp. MNU76]MCC9706985.1 hypothetical protein [Streptomyces sp. MNU76]